MQRLLTASEPSRAELWLDLGDLGDLVNPAGPHEQWQDHGLGLLRTILHQNGVMTDLASTRACTTWDQVRKQAAAATTCCIMNVRSYTFPVAYRSAQDFQGSQPNGLVITGGMHATVALDEMTAVPEFDQICQGPGENVIVDLVERPAGLPARDPGRRRQVHGRVADDRPHAVAQARQLEAGAQVQLAAGAGVRLGAAGPWPPSSPAASARGSACSATKTPTSPTWAAGRWTW